jgi:hypothetical protein
MSSEGLAWAGPFFVFGERSDRAMVPLEPQGKQAWPCHLGQKSRKFGPT